MGEMFSYQERSLQPRWLRTSEATRYSGIGKTRLKALAADPSTLLKGFPDRNSKRGDWIFDRLSIDRYWEAQQDNVSLAAQSVLQRQRRRLLG